MYGKGTTSMPPFNPPCDIPPPRSYRDIESLPAFPPDERTPPPMGVYVGPAPTPPAVIAFVPQRGTIPLPPTLADYAARVQKQADDKKATPVWNDKDVYGPGDIVLHGGIYFHNIGKYRCSNAEPDTHKDIWEWFDGYDKLPPWTPEPYHVDEPTPTPPPRRTSWWVKFLTKTG